MFSTLMSSSKLRCVRSARLPSTLFLILLAGFSLGNLACERGQQTVTFGYNKDYSPEQPIPFQHSLHAGKYTIPCLYCHTNVTESRHATVPSLNICMNCHVAVKTSSPWIKKLREHYEAGIAIPWVKVHMLPDFVMFQHPPHIKHGVACQTCHGPVETMDRIRQAKDLSMGWCINCHRKPENNAPTNCSTCHY
jgi:hypothetical protein